MIKSMTGFGSETITYGNKEITVEIKSLNSKFLDCNIKLPNPYKLKEVELRNLMTKKIMRGKVDFMLSINDLEGEEKYTINKDAVKQYFAEISSISKDLATPIDNVMATVLRLPNSIQAPENDLNEEEWNEILKVVQAAIDKLNKFRLQEGEALKNDVLGRIENINRLNEEIRGMEGGRIERIRQRIAQKMEELLGSDNYDKNRFEQEMIYFLEKLDISEEMTRLSTHCTHFKDTLSQNQQTFGKKLGFISQEIGREINTIGSKANDASIQTLVVQAKDDLEKVKEQILNIL